MLNTSADGLLTVGEVAQLLKISPVTIKRWLKQGRLRGYHVGPRAVRIKREDVDALMTPTQSGNPPALSHPAEETGRAARPRAEELERRQRLVATMRARRLERNITPLTTADLIRQARREQEPADAE